MGLHGREHTQSVPGGGTYPEDRVQRGRLGARRQRCNVNLPGQAGGQKRIPEMQRCGVVPKAGKHLLSPTTESRRPPYKGRSRNGLV